MMVPEIWSATDRIFCHFGPLLPFNPPNKPENQNFEKMKWIITCQIAKKNSISKLANFWYKCSITCVYEACQVVSAFLKKNFMAPFYGWGSIASRLVPVRGGSLLFTSKLPHIPGTHFTELRSMKGWVDLGATQWFWTLDPRIGNPAPWFKMVLEICPIEFNLFWGFQDIGQTLTKPIARCFYVCNYFHWIPVGMKIGKSIVFEVENQKMKVTTLRKIKFLLNHESYQRKK